MVAFKHPGDAPVNPNLGATAGSPEESADLSYQGNLSFYGQKACPNWYATSVSDQNQVGKKISSQFSSIFATWKFTAIFHTEENVVHCSQQKILFIPEILQNGTPMPEEFETEILEF